MKHFTLRPEHIALLRHAYIGWEECEFGAPAIDCKRPYGNSDVIGDIAGILGIELKRNDHGQRDEAVTDDLHAIHMQTQTALQIVLCTGSFEPGVYVQTREYDERSWERRTA